MVMLARAVLRHRRHDLGRNLTHAGKNDIRRRLQGTLNGRLWLWGSKLLNSFVQRKALGCGFRLQSSRLFVG